MDRAQCLDLAHAVCDPACRNSFDGKHAVWCHGRVVTDYWDAMQEEATDTAKRARELFDRFPRGNPTQAYTTAWMNDVRDFLRALAEDNL